MGFYINSSYKDKFIINNDNISDNFITIVNNEKIIFDLSNYRYTNDTELHEIEDKKSNINPKNCLYKISMDYGDGNIETHVKPIKSSESSWLIFEHLYAIEDESYFNKNHKIKINLYNLYGFVDTIEITYNIEKISAQQNGIELRLVSANLRNDKKISYIFNNINKNQLFIAKNKNKV